MAGRVPATFFATLAFGSLARAAVPADPTITAAAILPRQNNAQFIGYVQVSSTWYSQTCNSGLTWYQDGNYGQCCPTSLASCYAPTACVSGSLIYPYSNIGSTRTIACTQNFGDSALSICNTAFIFENLSDSQPKTDIVCGQSSVNWSYYRQLPASLTQVSSNPPTSIPQPVSSALVSPGSSGSRLNKKSKAWIAGAVVGPLVGLALVLAAILLFLRKRKNKKTAPQTGGAAMATADPHQPPPGVGGYTDAKPQFAPQSPPVQQQQQHYNPDPYSNQNVYNAQQAYAGAPTSPGPQYNGGAAAPVGASSDYYNNDNKHTYNAAPPAQGAAELGGQSSPTAASATGSPLPHAASPAHQPASPVHQAAELGGNSAPAGQTHVTSELPANNGYPRT